MASVPRVVESGLERRVDQLLDSREEGGRAKKVLQPSYSPRISKNFLSRMKATRKLLELGGGLRIFEEPKVYFRPDQGYGPFWLDGQMTVAGLLARLGITEPQLKLYMAIAAAKALKAYADVPLAEQQRIHLLLSTETSKKKTAEIIASQPADDQKLPPAEELRAYFEATACWLKKRC